MEDKIIDRLDAKKDKRRIKTKRKTEERAAFGGVFDSFTLENIHKMRAKGIIDEFVGIISAGKEANVYFAYGPEDTPLAVKIYKIDPQNTKWMKNYIIGDPRFKRIGTSTHKIIYTWCKKEYKNLQQLHRKGLRVPKPFAFRDNILVMEYIGEDNGTPAPRLKDAEEITDPKKELTEITEMISNMYIEAHLVHGDLSEYNILYYQNNQVIIDVSQAVSIYHINAPVFLKRDLINVFKFYENYLPPEAIPDPGEVCQAILAKAR